MLAIDGSFGEGGGQILRTSLSLSLITGRAFAIRNIRSQRAKPGLMPQHLKAVEAAAAVGEAHTEGAFLRSQTLVFEPGRLRPGSCRFDIGTAGAISLVLQTVLLPLAFAERESAVTITGGTHVPWSPCFHYLERQWSPYLREIGFDFDLRMELAGFYPAGGGCVHAQVRPVGRLSTIRHVERGELHRVSGISAVANLPESIAERQRAAALDRLRQLAAPVEIEIAEMPSRFKGTMLMLAGEFERSRCCYFGLGARGKPAERVALEASDQFLAFLATGGAIDQYLADQLILPLALSPGVSELRTSKITRHLLTNVHMVRSWLSVKIQVDGREGEPGSVRIHGSSV